MKYRKKPVVIEAFRWFPEEQRQQFPGWFLEAIRKETVHFRLGVITGEVVLTIDTLEGAHTAQPGDWIIRGVKGELCPCKPDIFEMTYEPVEE